jgi:hypothetical protein
VGEPAAWGQAHVVLMFEIPYELGDGVRVDLCEPLRTKAGKQYEIEGGAIVVAGATPQVGIPLQEPDLGKFACASHGRRAGGASETS